MRQLNQAGLDLLKAREGLRLKTYLCSANHRTIGYGHTGHDVHEGMEITLEEAEELLRVDINWAANAVHAATAGVPTTENQFAAMVVLTFNIGAPAFKTSSVLRFHKEGDYASAAKAFSLFDKQRVDGKLVVNQGLVNRRRLESSLYVTPDSEVE